MKKIIVIGCGISGLSTAYILQNHGFEVEIVAKDLLTNTVSTVAAAVWFPYKAEPINKVNNWATTSYEFYLNLKLEAWQGIEIIPLQILTNSDTAKQDWISAFPKSHHIDVQETPNYHLLTEVSGQTKGYKYTYELETLVIETPIFTPQLMEKFIKKGGKITQQTIHNFDDFVQQHSDKIIVNCTGLGSKKLLNDENTFPIQGQIVKIEKQTNTQKVILDEAEETPLAYIIPRKDAIILGGTAFANIDSEIPTSTTEKTIISRCLNIYPKLETPTILESIVGLRPGRTSVRVEKEINRNIIHNYGHGGSGYTINWGCALEVLELVKGAL